MATSCDVPTGALETEKTKLPLEKKIDQDNEEEVDQEDFDEQEEADTIDDNQIHPLQNQWSLWFFKNDRNNSWTDNLKKVVDFSTVEDFWRLINHITPASQLPTGCDYSLFKTGVQPMWEDKANRSGGRWLITLDKPQRNQLLNNYWLDLMMLLIGEAFDDDSEEICGAVVNIRNKGDRLSLWTADCENKNVIMRVGRKIKESLNLKISISYQSHDDQQNRTSSKTKSTFTV